MAGVTARSGKKRSRKSTRAKAKSARTLSSRLRARFAGIGLTGDITELRGQKARPGVK